MEINMGMQGCVILEDVTIRWTDHADGVELKANEFFVTVKQDGTILEDSFVAPGRQFMNALATAIAWWP
jgi:hypothetical protein